MPLESIKSLAESNEVELRRKAALSLVQEKSEEAIELLKKLIGDSNWRVRKAAVESAIQFPPEKVLPVLIEGLYDSVNAGMRNSCYEAILKIGDPALPYLYETIVVEDPDVKLSVIHLLGGIPNRASIPHLIYYLSHPNKNFVSAAIESLGKIKDPSNIPILIEMTNRADEWLLFHLIDALAEIGGPQSLEKLMELFYNRRLQKGILKAFGKMADISVVPFLFEMVERGEAPILETFETIGKIFYAPLPKIFLEKHQYELGKVINQYYPSELSEKIVELWKEAKITEKRGIIVVSGFVKDLILLPLLFNELQNSYLQRDAVWAIGEYGQLAFKNILKRLNETHSEEEKVLLIGLLSETESKDSVVPLLGFCRDDNEVVKREAISVLYKIDDIRVINELFSIFESENESLYDVTLNSIKKLLRKNQSYFKIIFEKSKSLLQKENPELRKIGYLLIGELRDKGNLEILKEGLNDFDIDVKVCVIEVLYQVAKNDALPLLLPFLSDSNPKIRRAIIRILGRELLSKQTDALIVSLQDGDIGVRAEAAFYLAQSTDKEIVKALLKLLESDVDLVRVYALRGLSEVGCGLLFEEVKRLFYEEKNPEIKRSSLIALFKSGRKEGKEILIEALNDINWEIRSSAIELIADSKDQSFVPYLLRELERDPDLFIKESIIDALSKIGATQAIPRLLHFLSDPALKDSVTKFFLSLDKENIPIIELEAKSVDFQTKLILTEILKHLENK